MTCCPLDKCNLQWRCIAFPLQAIRTISVSVNMKNAWGASFDYHMFNKQKLYSEGCVFVCMWRFNQINIYRQQVTNTNMAIPIPYIDNTFDHFRILHNIASECK